MRFTGIRHAAALIAFFFLIGGTIPAAAARYGKYFVTGAVELETKNETEDSQDQHSAYSSFEHRYKIDVQSFILSPRLLNYELGVSIGKGNTETNGASSSIDNLGYNARAELFSGRRINTSFYANRESLSSFVPLTASAGSALVSQTNTNYGALLNLNYRPFPVAINYDENSMEGSNGDQRLDRSVRRLQISANKDFSGFSSNYAYSFTDTADKIEQTNNTREHAAQVNLEKTFSESKTFRQDFRFNSVSRMGRFQDITSPTVTKNSDYTLTRADEIVRFDAVLANLTASLPSALGDAGRTFTIVKIDATANRVTVKPAGAETIGGAGSLILQTQWVEVTIISNGINWIIGQRAPNPGLQEESGVINLNSSSSFSYRPSQAFSNNSSLNVYYFSSEAGAGTNLFFSNSTNYQLNPELSVNASMGAGYTDSGGGATNASENISAGMNYTRKVGLWNLHLFENMGLNNSNQSVAASKSVGNAGLGASASRDYDWWKSNVTLQTQAIRSASSGGGGTTNWQASGAWSVSPSARVQLQSLLRYSQDDSKNDAIVAATEAGANTTFQPYSNSSRTTELDMNYAWLAYVSEINMATLSGGGVLSSQISKSGGGGGSQTDRSYFYSQLIVRSAPLRALFITMTLRGEWDNSVMDSDDVAGQITGTSTARTVYSMENALHFSIRRIMIELKHNWRNETGANSLYSRQSIYLKISRPF
ncbi:MAG: hypothetical protein M0P74_17440 [Syntrophales bacterium]|nr:hypothetical protein [Syntrophales bacterium]